MDRHILPVACLAVAISLLQGCGDGRTLNIVSYNVGTFTKYEENSMQMIAGMMKEIGADAISLNELDSCTARTGAAYQLKSFAGIMGGWQYKFGRAMPYDGGAYGGGIVVPADSKVVAGRSVGLPKMDGAEPRVMVVMELEDYAIASVHLDHMSETAQLAQVKVINTVMSDMFGDSSKPVFLCGDMNAEPDSPTMKEFAGLWTVITPEQPTFPSENPDSCIDYILALNNKAKYRVVKAEVLEHFSCGDVTKASDHLPVMVEVAL